MKALLDNQFAPVTFTCGFVESPFLELSETFVRWWNQITANSEARMENRRFCAPLPEALSALEPLTTPSDRDLLIETRSRWSAIFSNGLRVNDVLSPVSYLPTVLKSRGLNVVCVPDRSGKAGKDGLQIWGAVKFGLYGPDRKTWGNLIRSVSVTNDVGGWEFGATGEVQPFEQTENYRKRRTVDRFTPEMLQSYCAALGIDLFNEHFYGGECLLSHIKRVAQPGPTMSIAEARAHVFI